jgi:hypothetical protein
MKNNCINSGVPRRISTIAVVQNLIQRGAYIHIVAKQRPIIIASIIDDTDTTIVIPAAFKNIGIIFLYVLGIVSLYVLNDDLADVALVSLDFC